MGWIDLARAVCAAGVVLLHCFSGFAEGNPVPIVGAGRAIAWSALRLSLGRFGVPVFFMLTGYLLLDERRSFGPEKLGRYLARAAGLILVFGYPFNLVELAHTAGGFAPSMLADAALLLVRGISWGHMWYLYVLFFAYLLVPLLRGFVERAQRRAHLAALAVAFAFMGVWTVSSTADAPVFAPQHAAAVFYLLLGDYLRRYGLRDRRRTLLAGAAALVCAIVACGAYIAVRGEASYALEDYACPLVALWSLAVFELLRMGWARVEDGPAASAVRFVSDNSLGLYLLHPVLFNALYKGFGISPLSLSPGSFVLFWAAGVVFGLAGSALLRRLPVFSRLL